MNRVSLSRLIVQFAWIIGSVVPVSAQSEFVDYCQKKLEATTPGSLGRLEAGLQLSDALYHFDHRRQQQQILANRELARKLNSPNADAVCCLELAMVSYWLLGDGKHYDWRAEALAKFDGSTATPALKCRFYASKFLTELMLVDCNEIKLSMQLAGEATREIDDNILLASTYRKIAFVRLAYGAASMQDPNFEEMVSAIGRIGRESKLRTFEGWELALRGMDRSAPEARRKDLLEQADRFFVETNDLLGQTRTCGELAQIALAHGDYVTAHKLYERRLASDQAQGYLTSVYSDYLFLAKCAVKNNDNRLALNWLNLANEVPNYKPDVLEQVEHNQLEFESYLALGEHERAIEVAKNLVELDDLAEQARATANTKSLHQQVADLKNSKDLAIKALESNFQNAQERARQTSSWLTLALMAVTVGCFATLFQVYRMRLKAARAELDHQGQLKKQQQHVLENQKMQSLGLMAGGVAHDFNNLLVGIMCNAELLKMTKLPPDVDRRSILENLMTAANKAAELSQQMLTYAGRKPTEKLILDLNWVIQKNLLLFQSTAGKGCELVLKLSSDPALTLADLTQLEQILMNLLGNARKANSGQGKIVIHTGQQQLAATDLTQTDWFAQRTTGGLFSFLEVEDFGSGMNPSRIKHIFEPFYSGSPEGRGLGLAVVYGIVMAHEGIIRVFSREGFGTSIRIYFPHASYFSPRKKHLPESPELTKALTVPLGSQPAEFRLDTESNSAGFQLPGSEKVTKRILIVEDDPFVLKSITTMLQLDSSLTFATAENGQAALDLLSHDSRFDLILLDLVMPEVDGKGFLERMPFSIPVILMSGYSTELDELLSDERVRKIVGKPFSGTELLRSARLAIGKKTAVSEDSGNSANVS